jgi:uncharacterized protein YqgV (UPF0045/DUF77 family)|tara:strand:+ start:336 stop:596 length:261 start_codon:yes stop_codon:yes gene_type:complete
MKVSIELTLTPLSDDFEPSIKTFIKKIRNLNFKVIENPLSTQIFGEYDTLMSCIQETIKETFEEESFVMLNMKIVKGDRSKYVPSF